MPAVKNVTFSSKEEQYQKLTETMGDEWKVFEGDANPLHDAYIVDTNSPSDVKPVAEEAKKIEGVSEVQDGGANTERLFKLASFIRVWGIGHCRTLDFHRSLLDFKYHPYYYHFT